MKKNRKKKIDVNNMSTFQIICYFFNFFCRSFLYAVLSVIAFFIMICTIYYVDLMLNVKSGNYSIPLFGSYVIVSESMVPTININDCVIVKRSDENNFKIGDIITFLSDNKSYEGLTITHRIVGTQLNKQGDILYRTKGDNNNFDDPAYVPYNNIYGKVIFKIPKFGYVQNMLNNPFGIVLLFMIPLIIIIFSCTFKIIFKMKM